MDKTNNLFVESQKNWVHGYLGDKGRDIKAKTDYITFEVHTLEIAKTRKLFNKFHAAINASITVGDDSGTYQEFQKFNPLADGNVLYKNGSDKKIYGPFVLLEEVPFLYGYISMVIGLLSVKFDNLAAPYIKLIKEVSKDVGISVITDNLKLINTLDTGISELFKKNSIQIGRECDLKELSEGYYAVIGRESDKEFNIDTVQYDIEKSKLIFNGEPLTGYSYFVLKISSSQHKTTWKTIPSIQRELTQLIEDLGDDVDENLNLLTVFERKIHKCRDLLEGDAAIIVEEVKKRWSYFFTKVKGEKTRIRLSIDDLKPFE